MTCVANKASLSIWQAVVLMQVAVELSVPSVGLSPSLQTLQVAVNASVQQVTCKTAFLTVMLPM